MEKAPCLFPPKFIYLFILSLCSRQHPAGRLFTLKHSRLSCSETPITTAQACSLIFHHTNSSQGGQGGRKTPWSKDESAQFIWIKSFRSSLTILMFFLMLLRKGPVLHLTGIAQHFSLNCPINNGRPSFAESVF